MNSSFADNVQRLPDGVRNSSIQQFLSTLNREDWPNNLNCGQFTSRLRSMRGFTFNQLAYDRRTFDAYRSSVRRSIDDFELRVQELRLLPTLDEEPLFTVESPNIIDLNPNPPEALRGECKLHGLLEQLYSARYEIIFIQFSDQPQMTIHAAYRLRELCKLISNVKVELRKQYRLHFTLFDHLTQFSNGSINITELRRRLKERGIAPFGFLRMSNQELENKLNVFTLPVIRGLRSTLMQDLPRLNRALGTTVLP